MATDFACAAADSDAGQNDESDTDTSASDAAGHVVGSKVAVKSEWLRKHGYPEVGTLAAIFWDEGELWVSVDFVSEERSIHRKFCAGRVRLSVDSRGSEESGSSNNSSTGEDCAPPPGR